MKIEEMTSNEVIIHYKDLYLSGIRDEVVNDDLLFINKMTDQDLTKLRDELLNMNNTDKEIWANDYIERKTTEIQNKTNNVIFDRSHIENLLQEINNKFKYINYDKNFFTFYEFITSDLEWKIQLCNEKIIIYTNKLINIQSETAINLHKNKIKELNEDIEDNNKEYYKLKNNKDFVTMFDEKIKEILT